MFSIILELYCAKVGEKKVRIMHFKAFSPRVEWGWGGQPERTQVTISNVRTLMTPWQLTRAGPWLTSALEGRGHLGGAFRNREGRL